ncbi:DinB family protein [Actinopolymorpha sp. B17G11]|uniref:DinB family protein n=1 Tax=unclassified Actinopolymorpha TaxID=2627063 RepID=UPI0032D992C7
MPEHAMFKNDLRRSRLVEVDFSESRMHNIWMENARITGADFINTEIWGSCEGLTWDGIPIAPLVEAEKLRRFPEHAKMKPTTPEGFREAWSILEGLWAATVDRAQRLPEPMVHERVDGEWSFVETLRHLVGVTDGSVFRWVTGAQDYSWGPPVRGWGDVSPDPDDPTLEEVLVVRRDRMARVREIVDALTETELDRICDETTDPVRHYLEIVVAEEWAHHQYACRDLDVLQQHRSTEPSSGA